jgi:hypothetical protein
MPKKARKTFLNRQFGMKVYSKLVMIMVDRRRYSNVLHVRSFRPTDCDSDHYLVVAKVKERLAVNKQSSQRFHMERFNL